MNWLLKNTAIISALLLFTGYINYYTFYSTFDIDISTYLTTGELLLSFLPLTIPILGIISFSLIFLIQAITEIATKSKESEFKTEASSVFHLKKDVRYIKEDFKELRSKKFKFYTLFSLFIGSLAFLIKIIGILFFILFFIFLFLSIFTTQGNILLIPTGIWIVFSVIWYTIYIGIIDKTKGRMKYSGFFQMFVAYLLFLSLITINNKNKSNTILKGNSTYFVSFTYKNTEIRTDSNCVFVGKTNNFLFLRDIKTEYNKIYEFSQLENFKISKNSKLYKEKVFY